MKNLNNFRKKLKFVALLPAILILTGCIRYEGDLTITSQGLINGNILYAIDKSILSSSGINSLEDLKKDQSTSEQTDVCANPQYSENQSEFIITCTFNGANLKDSDLMARITDNQIEFLFKNQSDSDGSGICKFSG